MRLLVDVIPFDGGRSGLSQYARNVVHALAAQGHALTLVAEPGVAARFFPGLRAIEAPRGTRRAVFSMLWHLFVLPRRIRARDFDALLVLAANRRALWRCPLPTVGVVHDLAPYHVPEKYDALRMLYVTRVLPHYAKKMHRLVAISRTTAADLVQFWRAPAKKVAVVYNGFTPPAGRAGQEASRASDGERSSILYISRLEHPGKNHVGLIEAYGRLPRELAAKHPLVLVGGDWNGAEAVRAAAAASPYRDFIRFRGFVADADMPAVWAEAAAYVFPSFFEGFGLSLLEAMAAGVPVACAKTGALGELGAGVAELFDPAAPEEIAAALVKILTGDNAARLAAGRAKAAGFSWARCAAGLVAALPKAEVFGVPIRCETMAEAVDAAMGARGRAPRFCAFVNAHCLNLAFGDRDYAAILRRADRVWPDGTGVRMAGRHLGFAVPENVNGTDLFPPLIARAAAEGRSVFFYGAGPGVAEAAAANARKAQPALKVAGVCDGFVADDEAVRRVNAARPDILLVARGVPLQEKWIAAHLAELDCACAIAVGGLFDFVSGRIPRAPAWMRRLGVEWTWRLLQEPRRMFRRYVFGNPLFIWRVMRHG